MLREVDIRKKKTDSDFIKSLPSQPGKEFEIKKRLDKLRGTSNNFNNNNNVNPGGGGVDISALGPPPTLPRIEDLIDNGPSLFPPPPPTDGQEVISNVFRPPPPPPPGPVLNPFVVPKIDGDGPIGNNIFGSIGAIMGPRSEEKKNINDNNEIDDFLYKLPDNFPTLELGDKLLDTLGNVGEEVLADTPTKKNEEDTVLKDIIDEYNIPDMKNTMDETGEVPENIYFFNGGESKGFANALEFLGISPENREFAAFLLSDLGRKTMIQNKLSIHVDSGDTFYDNHNTEENFYSFLLSQQNEEAAFVPKKFSYSNTFEKYITSFLQNFSVDDQEKFDLLAFKNSKYLFYRFNNFVELYGNPRYRLLHTRKMKDSAVLKKIEDKNKRLLVEKIIHDVEFGNKNQIKSEIVETLESNYKVSRRVYQQLYYDIIELFQEYIQSIDLYEQQDIREDLKTSGWGAVQNIRTIKDLMRLMNMFQEFYVATGRLPTFKELLVVPDGDALPN